MQAHTPTPKCGHVDMLSCMEACISCTSDAVRRLPSDSLAAKGSQVSPGFLKTIGAEPYGLVWSGLVWSGLVWSDPDAPLTPLFITFAPRNQ